MKKFLLAQALILALASAAAAAEAGDTLAAQAAPLNTVNFSLFPPLSTNGATPKDNRFSFGLVAGSSASLNGVGLATFAQTVDNDLKGAAASFIYAGAGNVTGGLAAGIVSAAKNVTGVQSAGIINLAGDVRGIQHAGVLNLAKEVYGVQSAIVFNHADKVEGIQGAMVNCAKESSGIQTGLLNMAGKADGVQIGLINYSRENTGVPLGLLCLVRGNGPHLMSWTDESGYLLVGLRSGNEHGYSITALGSKMGRDPYGWCFALGLGLRSEVGDGYLALETLMQRANEDVFWQNGQFMTVKTRLVAGIPVGPARVFFGPSVNVYVGEAPNTQKLAYWQVDSYRGQDRANNDIWCAVWPGFVAGLEF
jgi:hypothetical protein